MSVQCEHLHTILYNLFFIGVCVGVGQWEHTMTSLQSITPDTSYSVHYFLSAASQKFLIRAFKYLPSAIRNWREDNVFTDVWLFTGQGPYEIGRIASNPRPRFCSNSFTWAPPPGPWLASGQLAFDWKAFLFAVWPSLNIFRISCLIMKLCLLILQHINFT